MLKKKNGFRNYLNLQITFIIMKILHIRYKENFNRTIHVLDFICDNWHHIFKAN